MYEIVIVSSRSRGQSILTVEIAKSVFAVAMHDYIYYVMYFALCRWTFELICRRRIMDFSGLCEPDY